MYHQVQQASLRWLKRGNLGFDGERMLISPQGQGFLTNGFQKMANLSDDDKCRFCKTEGEGVRHLIYGCQTLLGDVQLQSSA